MNNLTTDIETTQANSFELQPDQIQVGMKVALSGETGCLITTEVYEVKAIQLPLVVISMPPSEVLRWVIDTRKAQLTELSSAMLEALGK